MRPLTAERQNRGRDKKDERDKGDEKEDEEAG